jgi:RNA polymerase sigma-70 factor (ECF subfamily)
VSAQVSRNLLGEHRNYLFRFAVAKLDNTELAHDAVQETLLAALENLANFAGRSSLRTWLTAILKHKIIDLRRRLTRETLALDLDCDESLVDPDGYRIDMGERLEAAAHSWGDPESAFEQQKFWQVFERGLAHLPENASRVLLLREIMGQSTEDICRQLRITPANCWVLLHRARMGMRRHFEKHGFSAGAQNSAGC